MNKKILLRTVILLLVSVALAFGVEALQLATQPKRYEAEKKVIQEAGELDFDAVELVGAEVKSNAIATGAGSEIICDFGKDTPVPEIQIWNKKHLKADVPITIYYAAAGEDFSEDRSVSFVAEKNGVYWQPDFPAGSYSRLKFAIDGKMNIKSIVYSEAVEERVEIPESMQLWRVALVAAIVFVVLLFLFGVRAGHRFLGVCGRAWKGLTTDPKQTLIHLATFLAVGVAVFFAAKAFFCGGLGAELLWPQLLFCLAVGLIAACLVTFRKTLGAKPENLFLVICLCAGLLMVFLFSSTTLVSWDDEVHFEKAVIYSYLGEARFSSQDENNILMEIDSEGGYSLGESRAEWLARQQAYWEEGVSSDEWNGLETAHIYEFFPGVGLYLGRLLGLSYYWIFCLGKLFNLLTYTLCGYFGIRRLKSGKMILATALLIPLAVFQASVYSYDPGLNGFTALGLAYCFAEWQEPEKKLTWGNAGIIIGSMLFGIFAKAVYVPLLVIPLLLPKTKFRSAAEPGDRREMTRLAYYLLAAAAMLVLLATFLLPLLGGTMNSDVRGGENVDTYGQLSFILANPFRYLGILFGFLGDLLALRNINGLLTLFSYNGYGPYATGCLILLIVVALTDKKPCDLTLERSWWKRIFSLVVIFGIICIVCTSMYMAYSPVGADSISGVQHRYLIPLIYPVLMLLGSGFLAALLRIDKPWKQQLYNGLVYAVSVFILFSGIYTCCISKYLA